MMLTWFMLFVVFSFHLCHPHKIKRSTSPDDGTNTDCKWKRSIKSMGEYWSVGCSVFVCSEKGPGIISNEAKIGCVTKKGLCVDLNTTWTNNRSCIHYQCTSEGDTYLIKKTNGCKLNGRCYKRGEHVELNSCSIVECGLNNRFKAITLGCVVGDNCKKPGEQWIEHDGHVCKGKRCQSKLKRNRFTSQIKELSASGYCKEVFSDTCHKNKEAWYEYFPAKNVNGAGKCKKMKCGKKGPKPVKKSKACTYEDRCVLHGQIVHHRGHPDSHRQTCRCLDGHILCVGSFL